MSYKALLDKANTLVPFACKVVLLADRGFTDTELLRHLKRLGWHFRIRIKANFWIYQPGHGGFQVRDISHLEPSALLTLITWDGVGTESNRQELDVELGRWGYLDNTNVKYVVQPYYVPANSVAFRVPPGPYTHSFRWEPGKVTFSTVPGSGNTTGGRVINQHVFTSGVPSPEGESVRIALYVFHQGDIPLKNENDVIIDKFEYLP